MNTGITPTGRLFIIIGGHEGRDGQGIVRKARAKLIGKGKLVVATVASRGPTPLWEE